MAQVNFYKVTTLPGTLIADSVYFVQSGSFCEIYVTNNSGTGRLAFSSTEVNNAINTALAAQNALNIVADITARDTYFTGSTNLLCLVNDASADPTVTSGAALYSYRGSDGQVTKLTEYESLDLSLAWANITGTPTSTVADIDDAVTKRHTHTNKTQLDLIGESGGNLTYNGNVVAPVWSTLAW